MIVVEKNVSGKFHVSHTVHCKTINGRKVTNKCSGIVYFFLKFILV
jgi:hypothetical protein